jgi:pimeloyl-ACP methyl ester carboxylesterase
VPGTTGVWSTGRRSIAMTDGHFAAWEQPDLFAAEMRAAFRTLR